MKISGHRKCRQATREDEPGDEEEIFTAPEGKSNENTRERRGRGGEGRQEQSEKPNTPSFLPVLS